MTLMVCLRQWQETPRDHHHELDVHRFLQTQRLDLHLRIIPEIEALVAAVSAVTYKIQTHRQSRRRQVCDSHLELTRGITDARSLLRLVGQMVEGTAPSQHRQLRPHQVCRLRQAQRSFSRNLTLYRLDHQQVKVELDNSRSQQLVASSFSR